jgi:AcrR family transcriptional regulator
MKRMAQQESRVPVWAREENSRRTALSRDAIVRAAVALADTEGLSAVSIRRVAAELKARPMSLYTYIDQKDDLLDLMADEVATETLVPPEMLVPDGTVAQWRRATLAIARRERATVLRHPWLVELVTRRSMAGHIGPNMLRHGEQSIAALSTLDGDLTWKRRLLTAVTDYTTGFAVREAQEQDAARLGQDAALQPYLQRLADSGDFPNLALLLKHGGTNPDDDNFERGLGWLLDGFAAELAPPTQSPQPPARRDAE